MGLPGKIEKKVWAFESSSGSKIYHTILHTDGAVSCDCPGWTRRVAPDGSRSCKHTRAVDMGTADMECVGTPVDYSEKLESPAPKKEEKVDSSSESDLPKIRRIIMDD